MFFHLLHFWDQWVVLIGRNRMSYNTPGRFAVRVGRRAKPRPECAAALRVRMMGTLRLRPGTTYRARSPRMPCRPNLPAMEMVMFSRRQQAPASFPHHPLPFAFVLCCCCVCVEKSPTDRTAASPPPPLPNQPLAPACPVNNQYRFSSSQLGSSGG